jgi:myo-inositol-1(or 4)-monophosphatase
MTGEVSFTQSQRDARQVDLARIAEALTAATALLPVRHSQAMPVDHKEGGDPVTAAERAVDQLLFHTLVRDGEGWLSEEMPDDHQRLGKTRVWMVDPLDGTREYVSGIGEWCISIGLIENGEAVAGGVCNPATGEVFIGSRETGLTVRGNPPAAGAYRGESTRLVLASRSEYNRGEWKYAAGAPFRVRPVGSVAYKLALVAAGYADATWTFVPKHEWDVAGGVALVLAAQGSVQTLAGDRPVFNRTTPLLDGLAAVSRDCHAQLHWKQYLPTSSPLQGAAKASCVASPASSV